MEYSKSMPQLSHMLLWHTQSQIYLYEIPDVMLPKQQARYDWFICENLGAEHISAGSIPLHS